MSTLPFPNLRQATVDTPSVVEGERRILELIATGVELRTVLEAIATLFEAQTEAVHASIRSSKTARPCDVVPRELARTIGTS